ncbi:hypothetical 2-nitropropane dioxygenase [Primorskyibacter flagellatus]|uniref:Hypothetical 2-nitropropane dioxygenase n=1 Tax=Primorskyibacter flagellatus TaxID=1387277 RepID=A0A917ABC2_9RHOB|nr:nitronate monooxygenase [Primorskyibacter flagellatus]GGE38664.1 hypothetical 2-nitropropane dioxygenase [Primorskyibacter flagellatus]
MAPADLTTGTGTPARLETRFTRKFGLDTPIMGAPMDPASGSALAQAVSDAGGLGMVGGGYGDRVWLEEQLSGVKQGTTGTGFITWSMAKQPELLTIALSRRPKALMLSFADPMPFAQEIHDAGVPMICQTQRLEHVKRAVEAGATVVVAQGEEAGGHGIIGRSTLGFVPAAADWLAANSPETILLAAGGIADGRGLAAALMLGADGVLVGTRFWATQEALIHPGAKQRVLTATGDETVRTTVYDIVRGKDWPQPYNGRLMSNPFIETWHGREDALKDELPERVAAYEAASADGDFDIANVTVGEAIGIIRDIPPAAEVVDRMTKEALHLLGGGWSTL